MASKTWTELLEFLNQFPYLDLQQSWSNNALLLAEAQSVYDKMVIHRPEQTTGKGHWKSAVLWGPEGRIENTAALPYLSDTKSYSQKTDLTLHTPKIFKFVQKFIYLTPMTRIRLMCLDPDTEITLHRDTVDGSPWLSLNISLNMPKKCIFHIADEPSHHKPNGHIPFRNSGSAFFINSGKFHRVVNASKQKRFHIIMTGPFKISEKKLLRLISVGKVSSHLIKPNELQL